MRLKLDKATTITNWCADILLGLYEVDPCLSEQFREQAHAIIADVNVVRMNCTTPYFEELEQRGRTWKILDFILRREMKDAYRLLVVTNRMSDEGPFRRFDYENSYWYEGKPRWNEAFLDLNIGVTTDCIKTYRWIDDSPAPNAPKPRKRRKRSTKSKKRKSKRGD